MINQRRNSVSSPFVKTPIGGVSVFPSNTSSVTEEVKTTVGFKTIQNNHDLLVKQVDELSKQLEILSKRKECCCDAVEKKMISTIQSSTQEHNKQINEIDKHLLDIKKQIKEIVEN